MTITIKEDTYIKELSAKAINEIMEAIANYMWYMEGKILTLEDREDILDSKLSDLIYIIDIEKYMD